MLVPAFAAGAIAGMMGIAIPAAGPLRGDAPGAGLGLGLFAGASAVGGLVYGALRLPGSRLRHQYVAATALVAAAGGVALVTTGVAIMGVLLVAGLFAAPVMITSYLSASQKSPDEHRTAATTWVNTIHNAGSAAASAAMGWLVDLGSAPSAIGIVTASLLTLLVLTGGRSWFARRSRRRPYPASPSAR